MSGTAIIGAVSVFLLVIIGIGIYAAKQIDGDSVNYIVAGRQLILPLAAATLMAQSLDANATLGNTDLTAEFGFWAGAALPVGLALCLTICGLFFAKPLNRMKLITMPDFFRKKYGRTTEVAASVVTVMSFVILLAGNLVAGGFLFETFLGTSYRVGVVLLAVIILIYTLTGGLFAVAYTDVLQAGIALVGSLALVAYVAVTYGLKIPAELGPTDFSQLTAVGTPESGAMINLATIVALGFGNLVALDFNERLYSADSPTTARRACFAAAAGTLLIGIPFSFVAMGAGDILAQAGASADGVPVLYALIDNVLPAWLGVTVLLGIVGASLSTGDGAVLATSSVIARNVIGIRPEKSGPSEGNADRLLFATRGVAVGIATLGALFALSLPETGLLLVLAFDISLAGIAVPFILGLYWSKANRPAALGAIVTGAASRIGFFVLMPTTYGLENTLLYLPNEIFTAAFDGFPTFISPLAALGVFVIIALLTQSAETEESAPASRPSSFADD